MDKARRIASNTAKLVGGVTPRCTELGCLLFQFPPWFGIRKSNKEYMLEVASRCKPLRAVFELRNASWFEGANRNETLDFLAAHRKEMT